MNLQFSALANLWQFFLLRLTKCITMRSILVNDLNLVTVRIPLVYTVKPLLEDALLFNSRILERASIQVFQNVMYLNFHKITFLRASIQDALLFNSRILERASLQDFQNFIALRRPRSGRRRASIIEQ